MNATGSSMLLILGIGLWVIGFGGYIALGMMGVAAAGLAWSACTGR